MLSSRFFMSSWMLAICSILLCSSELTVISSSLTDCSSSREVSSSSLVDCSSSLVDCNSSLVDLSSSVERCCASSSVAMSWRTRLSSRASRVLSLMLASPSAPVWASGDGAAPGSARRLRRGGRCGSRSGSGGAGSKLTRNRLRLPSLSGSGRRLSSTGDDSGAPVPSMRSCTVDAPCPVARIRASRTAGCSAGLAISSRLCVGWPGGTCR